MSTDKQLIANQKNAQLSTGPVSEAGKIIVSTNAIKHGIFTKDLIMSSSLGQENEEEYNELLNNLIGSLSPENQMESLLVEKIAVDFWRLRRVIRFEVGSIGKYLKSIFDEFYSHGKKNNEEIDREIRSKRESIEWNYAFIECLKKEEVSFDQPLWKGPTIESDIVADFYLLVRSFKNLPQEIRDKLYFGDFNFEEIKAIVKKNGYSTTKEISAKLIELYSAQNQDFENEIQELEEKKPINIAADKLNSMLGLIPQEASTEKVLKYERSLQKSIYENLFLLKKLQGMF